LVGVPLERQSIEKKDFPIGRRGYDPEAVDAHLKSLADELEEFKRSSRRRTETVASAASDQVRAIVDAAESSAAEIQKQAEEDAQETRAEAASEAQATRERATEKAREYVGNVSQSTSVMLQRLDAMESELVALIDALRIGSNRLNADLQLLESNLEDVKGAAGLRDPFEPEAPTTDAQAATESAAANGAEAAAAVQDGASGAAAGVDVADIATDDDAAADAVPASSEVSAADDQEVEDEGYDGEDEDFDEPVSGAPRAEPVPTTADAGAAATVTEAAAGSDDIAGARLIALNMALSGTPREETDRYLAENFELADRDQLLDEVYGNVEQ
jgi:DivIVA domain-containing protein